MIRNSARKLISNPTLNGCTAGPSLVLEADAKQIAMVAHEACEKYALLHIFKFHIKNFFVNMNVAYFIKNKYIYMYIYRHICIYHILEYWTFGLYVALTSCTVFKIDQNLTYSK